MNRWTRVVVLVVGCGWLEAARALALPFGATATSDAGIVVAHPSQSFVTRFEAHGLEVTPRGSASTTPEWSLRLSLVRWGRQGSLESVPPAAPGRQGSRIEYGRGSVTEWYVQDARGLEQGFDLDQRPPGPGPVVLEMMVSGSLTPRQASPGGAVSFHGAAGGMLLRYSDLEVRDAGGARIPATLVLSGATLCIEIDDASARYPLSVDPVLGEDPVWWQLPDAGYSDRYVDYGMHVAPAGDVNGDGYTDVLVSDPRFHDYYDGDTKVRQEAGLVHLFLGSAYGLGGTAAKVWVGGAGGDHLGSAIGAVGDVDGDGYDDVLIGAEGVDAAGTTSEGAIHLSYGHASGIDPNRSWIAYGAASDLLGTAVSGGDVNGDGFSDIVAGASNNSACYLWLGRAGGLLPGAAADWKTDQRDNAGGLGRSAIIAGDLNGDGFDDVVLGAPGYVRDWGEGQRAGCIFTWFGSAAFDSRADGTFANADWSADSGTSAYCQFGFALAGVGDLNADGYADLAVGAFTYDNAMGRVFLWTGGQNGLDSGVGDPNHDSGAQADWVAVGDQPGAEFGYTVASGGDVNGDRIADLIVGQHLWSSHGAGQEKDGRVLVWLGAVGFENQPDGTPANTHWSTNGDEVGQDNGSETFGMSVATTGDADGDGFGEVIIGSPSYDHDWSGATGRGAAFVYRGSGRGVLPMEAWNFVATDQSLGPTIANAGDVNGDGLTDVIVGAPNDLITFGPGAHVFLGTSTGVSATPVWSASEPMAEEAKALGYQVGSAGDVNHDCYGDVYVSAPGTNEMSTLGPGAVFLWYGSGDGEPLGPDGTADNADWSALGEFPGLPGFGLQVASLDLNGDQYPDLIVADPLTGYSYRGKLYLYLNKKSTGLERTPSWTLTGSSQESKLGSFLSRVGDVNGDQKEDFVAWSDVPGPGSNLYLYLGKADGKPALASGWPINLGDISYTNDLSIAAAGDVNGDTIGDLLVGYPDFEEGTSPPEGVAYVFLGVKNSGPSTTPSWRVKGDVSGGLLGAAVASAGDVDRNGCSDVLVGAPGCNPDGGYEEGKVFLYLGSETGLPDTSDDPDPAAFAYWTAVGESLPYSHTGFGATVALAGDVNGDGISDFAVGSGPGAGKVHCYFGSAPGWTSPVLKKCGSGITASSAEGFELATITRSAAGRGRVRLEVEVKPSGQLFDGTGLLFTSWVDSGDPSSPSVLEQLIDGLVPCTPYIWRARVATTSAQFPHGAWYYPPGNAPTETDTTTDPILVVTGVSPDRGSYLGGEHVLITGECFTVPGIVVTFGGVPSPGVTVRSRIELDVVVPRFPREPRTAAGVETRTPWTSVDVRVTTIDGSATLSGGFTYDRR